jgi:hypothetical protein
VASHSCVAQSLEEITQLSIGFDQVSGKFLWQSEKIDLGGIVRTAPFYFEGNSEQIQGLTFRSIGKNKFEATNVSGDTHIVFVPSFSSNADIIPVKFVGLNVWTAPLGHAKSAIENIMLLSKPDVAYLHHDLSRVITVVMDSSFPSEHLSALKDSLSDWNKALGKKIFKLSGAKVSVDTAECLSSRKLCVKWTGSSVIPWTGVSGSTVHAFDPETGVILGGVITFSNGVDEKTLRGSPAEIDRQFISGKIDLSWIAQIFLRKPEFSNYRHPMPELVVKSILEHEIGHYNGLAHNFAGSHSGTVAEPSATVMDYFPFSAIRNLKIGTFDHEVIKAVYSGVAPGPSFEVCTDFEKDGFPGIQPKIAACNAFDFGEPVLWYSSLGDLSSNGVFAKIEGDPHDFLYYLGSFLSLGGKGTLDEQRRVREYLCAKKDLTTAISQELNHQWGVPLSCP